MRSCWALLLLLLAGCEFFEEPQGKMPPTLALGSEAPEIIFTRLMSEQLNQEQLSALKGKVVYLDFWASWCNPCLKSFPMLNEMRTRLNRDDFEIVAVNLDDDPEKGRAFIRERSVDFIVARADSEQAGSDQIYADYQLYGLPTSYLIDKNGKLRFSHQGFNPEKIEDIEAEIIELLDES